MSGVAKKKSAVVRKAPSGPVNVPGAARNRLRAVVENKPDADYEIVHGVVMLQNPDNVGKAKADWVEPYQVAYYPGECIRLSWADASPMMARGIVCEAGSEHVVMTTAPEIVERPKGWVADEEESKVRRVRVDVETAASVLYDADSKQRGMGGFRGAGR